MKKLNLKYFTIIFTLFIFSCDAPTVGYNTYEWGKDYKFSLGSEESIETALAFDKAWGDRDFELMKELSSDSIKFYFGDGIERDFEFVENAAKNRDSIRASRGATVESEIKHAYSLVINPNNGWEGVNAHIVYTYNDTLGNFNEWRQFERFSVKDGVVQRFAASWQDIPSETE